MDQCRNNNFICGFGKTRMTNFKAFLNGDSWWRGAKTSYTRAIYVICLVPISSTLSAGGVGLVDLHIPETCFGGAPKTAVPPCHPCFLFCNCNILLL